MTISKEQKAYKKRRKAWRPLSAHKKPWLNEDGSLKSDAEIKKLGQTWSQETWTRYLDATMGKFDVWNKRLNAMVGVPNKRVVFFPYMDTAAMASRAQFSDFISDSDKDSYPSLDSACQVAIKGLSKKERSVLKMIFWEEKSPSEIAKELKITPSTVRVLKMGALKKLREIFASESFLRKLRQKKKQEKTKLSA